MTTPQPGPDARAVERYLEHAEWMVRSGQFGGTVKRYLTMQVNHPNTEWTRLPKAALALLDRQATGAEGEGVK